MWKGRRGRGGGREEGGGRRGKKEEEGGGRRGKGGGGGREREGEGRGKGGEGSFVERKGGVYWFLDLFLSFCNYFSFNFFFFLVVKMFEMFCDFKRQNNPLNQEREREREKEKERKAKEGSGDVSKGKFFEMLKQSAKETEEE